MTDGTKTIGTKIYVRDFSFGTVALASSTEDGLAAESLAEEVFSQLQSLTIASVEDVLRTIREQMQEWHRSYTAGTAPPLSYLLVVSASNSQGLYVVEPPRTVVPKNNYAIGSGARVAQPILDRVIGTGQFRPRESMMFLVYMAKHAEAEMALIGGGFDALFIPIAGAVRRAYEADLYVTSEMVYTVDSCIDGVLQLLMLSRDEAYVDDSIKYVADHVAFTAKQLVKRELFSSLEEIKPSAHEKRETEP